MKHSKIYGLILMLALTTAPAQAALSLYRTYMEAGESAKLKGQLKEAERLYREALKISEEGDDDIAVDCFEQVAFDLAELLQQQGKDKEAADLVSKIAAGKYREIKGKPFLYRYLAQLLIAQGRYSEAEEALKHADEAQRGKKNYLKPTAAQETIVNVMKAVCALAAKKDSVAHEKLKATIEIADMQGIRSKDSDIPVDTNSVESVTAWLVKNHFSEAAEILARYTLESSVKKTGLKSKESIKAASQYAGIKLPSSTKGDTTDLAKQVFDASPNSPERLQFLELKLDQISTEDAQDSTIALIREALTLSEKSRGLNNEKSNQLRYKLLTSLKKAKRANEAEKHMLQTIKSVEKESGADSTQCGDMLLTLAYFLYDKDPQKSSPVLTRAIKIFERAKKPMSAMEVSSMLVAQANNLSELKDYTASDALFKRSIAIWEKLKSEAQLLMVLPDYEKMLRKAGKKTEAAAAQKRAEDIFQKHGGDHGMVAFGRGAEVTEW